jgi:hypothetical protein
MTTSPFCDFEMGDGLRGVACCRKTRGSRVRERMGGSVRDVLEIYYPFTVRVSRAKWRVFFFLERNGIRR